MAHHPLVRSPQHAPAYVMTGTALKAAENSNTCVLWQLVWGRCNDRTRLLQCPEDACDIVALAQSCCNVPQLKWRPTLLYICTR
jgi:hypothetical protein